eukprot:GDKJ01054349.1.p1 GENE.GDKJ01054349.1~~GDKJ01054349.1.p1  ORF type:complete len:498 (+),score=44.03 GDKJ01054349.1:53-1546(+)
MNPPILSNSVHIIPPSASSSCLNAKDPFFANAKFVIVCLIIIAHFMEIHLPNSPYPNHIVRGFYVWGSTFLTPSFCILLGYFGCRIKNDYNTSSFGRYFLRYFVMRYFLWQCIYSFFFYFAYFREGDTFPSTNESYTPDLLFEPFFHLWIPFAAIIWNFITPMMTRSLRFPLASSCFIGLLSCVSTAEPFLALFKTVSYLPFYVLGFQIRNRLSWKVGFENMRRIVYSDLSHPFPSLTLVIPILSVLLVAPFAFLFSSAFPHFIDCPLWFGDSRGFCSVFEDAEVPKVHDSINILTMNKAFFILVLSKVLLYVVGPFMSFAVLSLIPSSNLGIITNAGEKYSMTAFYSHVLFLMTFHKLDIFKMLHSLLGNKFAPLGSLLVGMLVCLICFFRFTVLFFNVLLPPLCLNRFIFTSSTDPDIEDSCSKMAHPHPSRFCAPCEQQAEVGSICHDASFPPHESKTVSTTQTMMTDENARISVPDLIFSSSPPSVESNPRLP